MPIATAYIGASFPPEKRGSALGFVGSIYGIATVIGPTLGTAILSLAGSNNWGYLFLINVPISLIILFLAFRLEENRNEYWRIYSYLICFIYWDRRTYWWENN